MGIYLSEDWLTNNDAAWKEDPNGYYTLALKMCSLCYRSKQRTSSHVKKFNVDVYSLCYCVLEDNEEILFYGSKINK